MLSLHDLTSKELRGLADWLDSDQDFGHLVLAGLRPVIETSDDPTQPDRFIGWERVEEETRVHS